MLGLVCILYVIVFAYAIYVHERFDQDEDL